VLRDELPLRLSELIDGVEELGPECAGFLHSEDEAFEIGQCRVESILTTLGSLLFATGITKLPTYATFGKMTSGKTSALVKLLGSELTSGKNATTRLFTLLRASGPEGWTLAKLGRVELSVFLRMLERKLIVVSEKAPTASQDWESGIQERARLLSERWTSLLGDRALGVESSKAITTAAVMCESIHRYANPGQLRLTESRVGKEEADQYAYWEQHDENHPMMGKVDKRSKADVDSYVSSAFYSQDPKYDAGLLLPCLGYVGAKDAGLKSALGDEFNGCWADSPGTESNLHDDLKQEMLAKSSIGAIYFLNARDRGEDERQNEWKELAALFESEGVEDYSFVSTHFDLTDPSDESGWERTWDDFPTNKDFATRILRDACTCLFVEGPHAESAFTRRLLTSEDPADAGRLVLFFEPHGSLNDTQQRIQRRIELLREFRSWLPQESRKDLPLPAQEILQTIDSREGVSPTPDFGIQDLDVGLGLDERAIRRLMAALVCLGEDGGESLLRSNMVAMSKDSMTKFQGRIQRHRNMLSTTLEEALQSLYVKGRWEVFAEDELASADFWAELGRVGGVRLRYGDDSVKPRPFCEQLCYSVAEEIFGDTVKEHGLREVLRDRLELLEDDCDGRMPAEKIAKAVLEEGRRYLLEGTSSLVARFAAEVSQRLADSHREALKKVCLDKGETFNVWAERLDSVEGDVFGLGAWRESLCSSVRKSCEEQASSLWGSELSRLALDTTLEDTQRVMPTVEVMSEWRSELTFWRWAEAARHECQSELRRWARDLEVRFRPDSDSRFEILTSAFDKEEFVEQQENQRRAKDLLIEIRDSLPSKVDQYIEALVK